MELSKPALRHLIALAVRGPHDGLSRLGAGLEKLASYIVFVARNARQDAKFRVQFAETPTSSAAPARDAIVYDIGANNGDDTDYYLKKGLRVMAIEANPVLAAGIAHRFSDSITDLSQPVCR